MRFGFTFSGTTHSSFKKRRGFNLVEAAIVLGVVGLVIGGIWVAASTVSENQRVGDTMKGIATIHSNVQAMYYGQAKPDISSIPTEAYIAAKVFPADWVVDSENVKSPWGGVVTPNLIAGGVPYRLVNRLFFNNIPKSICIKMLMQLHNLKDIGMATTGGFNSFTTFPITLQAATTGCTNANFISIPILMIDMTV